MSDIFKMYVDASAAVIKGAAKAGMKAGNALGHAASNAASDYSAGRGARRGILAPGDPPPPPNAGGSYYDFRGVLSLRKVPPEYQAAEFPLGRYVDPAKGPRQPIGLPSGALETHAAVVAPNWLGKDHEHHRPVDRGWSASGLVGRGDRRQGGSRRPCEEDRARLWPAARRAHAGSRLHQPGHLGEVELVRGTGFRRSHQQRRGRHRRQGVPGAHRQDLLAAGQADPARSLRDGHGEPAPRPGHRGDSCSTSCGTRTSWTRTCSATRPARPTAASRASCRCTRTSTRKRSPTSRTSSTC